jgi:hypothetical protein
MTASQKKVVQYLKTPFGLLRGRSSGGEEKVLRVLPDLPGDTLTVQDFAGKLAMIDFHERKRQDRAVIVPTVAQREVASA